MIDFFGLLFLIMLFVINPGAVILLIMVIALPAIGWTIQNMTNKDKAAKAKEQYKSARQHPYPKEVRSSTTIDFPDKMIHTEIKEMRMVDSRLIITADDGYDIDYDTKDDIYVTIDTEYVLFSLFNHTKITVELDGKTYTPDRLVDTPLGILVIIGDECVFLPNTDYTTKAIGTKAVVSQRKTPVAVERGILDDKGIPFSVEQLGVLYTNEAYDLKYEEGEH